MLQYSRGSIDSSFLQRTQPKRRKQSTPRRVVASPNQTESKRVKPLKVPKNHIKEEELPDDEKPAVGRRKRAVRKKPESKPL